VRVGGFLFYTHGSILSEVVRGHIMDNAVSKVVPIFFINYNNLTTNNLWLSVRNPIKPNYATIETVKNTEVI
jgi:hypothetical protein